jgi:tetratricopeptide (TPR) repeat protein
VLAGKVSEPPRGRSVPAWLRRAVLRGLAPAPADRYPSMDALLAALARDPAVTRRRALGIAGIVLALGVGVWGLARAPGRRARPARLRRRARPARRRVGRARPRARRGRVRQERASVRARVARQGRGRPRWLRRRLASARQDACLATHVRHEQSAELLDRRVACLDARRAALAALVDVLAGADEAVIERAVDAVAGLPSPRDCADRAALLATTPPPTAPAARARLAELRVHVAQARALVLAGRYDAARAVAAPAVAAARDLGYPPALGEAALALADAAVLATDLPGAEKAFLEACDAAEVGHDDRTAALAWIGLAEVVAGEQAQVARGAEISHRAQIAVARAGGGDELAEALELALGRIAFQQSDWDARARAPRRAIALGERQRGTASDVRPGRAATSTSAVYSARGDFAAPRCRRASARWRCRRPRSAPTTPRWARPCSRSAALLRPQPPRRRARRLPARRAIYTRALGADDVHLAAVWKRHRPASTRRRRATTSRWPTSSGARAARAHLRPEHIKLASVWLNIGTTEKRAAGAPRRSPPTSTAWPSPRRPSAPSTRISSAPLGGRRRRAQLGRAAEARAHYARAFAIEEKAYGPSYATSPTSCAGSASRPRARPGARARCPCSSARTRSTSTSPTTRRAGQHPLRAGARDLAHRRRPAARARARPPGRRRLPRFRPGRRRRRARRCATGWRSRS